MQAPDSPEPTPAAAEAIEPTALELLRHLSLLFIPAGVGIMVSAQAVRGEAFAVIASLVVAVVVVGTNYFLLYSYVGALINPAVSAGIVLIFTLLLWVNIVVRVYLAALCWVTTPSAVT